MGVEIVAVTFDVYGTLVQYHEAVEGVLGRIIAEAGADVALPVLKAEFLATPGPLQQGTPWMPYKDVLRLGLLMALAKHGLQGRPEHGEWLVTAIAEAPPFPAVPAALGAGGSEPRGNRARGRRVPPRHRARAARRP